MVSIHHTVIKKAAKHGLTMISVGDRVEVRTDKDKVLAFHVNPSKALDTALDRLESDRLRVTDKDPKDREPELKPTKAVEKNGEDTAPVQLKGGIIKPQFRDRYKKNGGNCGDDLAAELTAATTVKEGKKTRVDAAKLKAIAEANGVWRESYSSLNVGQQRMNVSNRLRNKLREGEKVKIGSRVLQDE